MIENLYRSPTDKWIGGVAGGFAKRFGLPTIVVRLLFLLAAVFLNVIAAIVYLVLWLVVPEAPPEVTVEQEVAEAGSEAAPEETVKQEVAKAGSEAPDA